jgi:hypothetical protein
MTGMNRTALAFLAILPLAVIMSLLVKQFDLTPWATTGLAMLSGLIISLIDREGFYGPRTPPSR